MRMKIGLMLPIGQQELLAGPDRWSLFRDMALAADASGLDSVWCADHLLFRHDEASEPGGTDGIHEAWTILSAVAAITTRVQIGPLVLCVPFRNPALTAKMATTLDEVSGGRLILGLGCGWHEPEFDAFGYEFDHRVGQFAEALEIIVPMLRTGTATFDGRWQRAADARPVPPGPRPNGPPILIAGKRSADAGARGAPRRRMERGLVRAPGRCARAARADHAAPRRTRRRGPAARLARADGRDLRGHRPGRRRPTRRSDHRDSDDEIGEALAGYEALGVSHLIVHLWPHTPEAVAQLGSAAAVARERTAARGAAV